MLFLRLEGRRLPTDLIITQEPLGVNYRSISYCASQPLGEKLQVCPTQNTPNLNCTVVSRTTHGTRLRQVHRTQSEFVFRIQVPALVALDMVLVHTGLVVTRTVVPVVGEWRKSGYVIIVVWVAVSVPQLHRQSLENLRQIWGGRQNGRPFVAERPVEQKNTTG